MHPSRSSTGTRTKYKIQRDKQILYIVAILKTQTPLLRNIVKCRDIDTSEKRERSSAVCSRIGGAWEFSRTLRPIGDKRQHTYSRVFPAKKRFPFMGCFSSATRGFFFLPSIDPLFSLLHFSPDCHFPPSLIPSPLSRVQPRSPGIPFISLLFFFNKQTQDVWYHCFASC